MQRLLSCVFLAFLALIHAAAAADLNAATPAGTLAPRFSTGGQWLNSAINTPINSTLVADSALAPIAWSVTAGALPPGMSLSASGAFTGTSTATGEHAFVARITDGSGVPASAEFVISINASATAGSVQQLSFVAASTGLPVNFSLYLPPSYGSSTRRYPVLFHLHGIGGTHNGNQISVVPRSLEAAVRAGLVPDLIVVFPDGYQDAFWADSVNSAKPAETHVVQELVPYIDAHYRTITAPGFRIVQGFSMGGFGAAKFATKFPSLFATCVIYDGAMLTWPQVQQRHAQQAQEIFNNDGARFDLYSPWSWLSANSASLSAGSAFRDAVGALISENRAWRDALALHGQSADYVETGLPHAIGPLLDAQGANNWALVGQRLAQADSVSASGFE